MRRLGATCTLMMCAVAGGALEAEAQTIRILEAEASHPSAEEVRFRIVAEPEDMELGSFFVSLTDWSLAEQPNLPLFTTRNEIGSFLLTSPDMERDGHLLPDGGTLDESDREHVYQVTLSTADWPEGVYYFNLGAHNRPQTGAYVSDSRTVRIVIGDPDEQRMSQENAPEAEHRIIYKKEGVYGSFPDLRHLPDGRLGTSFGTRIRASHIDMTGGTAQRVSADGGYTWEEPDDNEPLIHGMWQTEDGRAVTAEAVGWVYVDEDQREELEAQGRRVRDVRPGAIAYLGGAQSRVSEDGGRTWDRQPIEIPDSVVGLMHYTKPATELLSSEGIRLVSIYGRRFDEDGGHGRSEVFFLRSDDDGSSWDFIKQYPDGHSIEGLGFNETAITETTDGRILAVMRTTDEAEMYQSFSDDGGLTWSQPENTGVWGFPCHLLTLEDGRVLMSYGYRRRPMGIRAVISDDHGRTWNTQDTFILRDDGYGTPGDLGYPMSIELESNRIFTIYYHTTHNGITHVAGTHWRVPEAR